MNVLKRNTNCELQVASCLISKSRLYKSRVLFSVCLAFFTIWSLLSACQPNPYKHGEILYQNFCMNCHMEDGTGLVGNIPPLAGADFLTRSAEQLPCIIRYGISDTLFINGITYTTPMAGVPQLTDIEITNVINYINHAWGNENGFTKPTDVEKYLKTCE